MNATVLPGSCGSARRARPLARRAVAALLGAVLLPCPAAHATTREPAPDVLLVCIDTLRADRLGAWGYTDNPTSPALDALAARGTLFRDASAAAGWTKPSVPSFLTGALPAEHGVYEGSARGLAGATTHLVPQAAVTLAERFRAAGYATAAIVHNAQLRAGGGFEQGFGHYDDQGGDAADIRARALAWLDGRPRGQPFFLYLHVLDAHWPYDVPDEAARRFSDGDVDFFRGEGSRALRDLLNDGLVALDDAQRATLSDLYDASIRHVDDQFGALLVDLARRDLSPVVSVVADHGEEFFEHGRLGHGHGLWQGLLHVPWILHVPGQVPQVVTTPVGLCDLPATLLAAAGLPVDDLPGGTNRLAFPGRAGFLLAEHKAPDRYEQSLRLGARKLIRRWQPPAGATGDDADDAAVAAAATLLAPGTRWEAEIERRGAVLYATQIKPRGEPAVDPLELKARVAPAAPGGFELAGVPVTLLPGAAHSGDEAARAAGLVSGAAVKARGQVLAGTLHCDKLKFYAPDEAGEDELRGTVQAVEVHGDEARVCLQGLWVAFDEDTEWKGVALPTVAGDGGLTRETLAAALARGGDAAATAGWTVSCELYDLAADPGERTPLATWTGVLQPAAHPDIRRFSAALDQSLAELLARRLWSGGDEAVLDETRLADLRRIGYVR